MSGDRAPWWYSGGEDAVPEDAVPQEDVPQEEQGTALDWTALALGAQRLVDWASERLLTPHAEHGAPADHPACVVCRTQVLLGEAGPSSGAGSAAEGSEPDATDGGSGSTRTVEWIPIVAGPDPAGMAGPAER